MKSVICDALQCGESQKEKERLQLDNTDPKILH